MKAIAGTAYFKLDAQQFDLRGNCRVNMAAFQREGVVGLDRVHGFKQTPVIPYIEVELSDQPTLSLANLMGVSVGTVTVELINGKTYVLREAYCATAVELNVDDGMFQIRFEGAKGEELLAAATA